MSPVLVSMVITRTGMLSRRTIITDGEDGLSAKSKLGTRAAAPGPVPSEQPAARARASTSGHGILFIHSSVEVRRDERSCGTGRSSSWREATVASATTLLQLCE